MEKIMKNKESAVRQLDSYTWGYTWGGLIINLNLIKLRLNALDQQANEFLEGKLKEFKHARRSKKWLIESIRDTEYELSVNKAIRKYSKKQRVLPELVGDRMKDLSKKLPEGDKFFDKVIKLTTEVCTILSRPETKNIADEKLAYAIAREEVISLGLEYITSAMDTINWFERTLDETLRKDQISIKSNTPVPEAVHSIFKQFESLAYLMGYAGMRFVTYELEVQNRKQKKWCRICFRRTELGRNYCHLHPTGNDDINEFRFGEKVRQALLEHEPEIFKQWELYKRNIIDIEIYERDSDRSAVHPLEDWKAILITFINERSALKNCLSVEVIQSQNTRRKIVEILQKRFNNPAEESLNIISVVSWLAMANDWLEIENRFNLTDIKSKSPTRPRDHKTKSKSAVSSLPMSSKISDLCIGQPGIREEEIAQILKVTKTDIVKQIKTYKELQIFFPWLGCSNHGK
jgi:hypothetical protein